MSVPVSTYHHTMAQLTCSAKYYTYLPLTFSIVAIDTVSPQGLSKSMLTDGPEQSQWHVNITWMPDESQFGPNIFCYTAKDSMG